MRKLIVTPFFEMVSKDELKKFTSEELEILFDDFADKIVLLCDTRSSNKDIFRTLNYTRIKLSTLNLFSDKAEKKCANY